MKTFKIGKELKQKVNARVLAKLNKTIAPYGYMKAFAKSANISFRTLQDTSLTGKATPTTIKKIQKALKAA